MLKTSDVLSIANGSKARHAKSGLPLGGVPPVAASSADFGIHGCCDAANSHCGRKDGPCESPTLALGGAQVSGEASVSLETIFRLEPGNGLDLSGLVEADDGVAYVSRSGANNGVAARVVPPNGSFLFPSGSITVSLGVSVLAAFLQFEPFITGQNVAVLTPRNREMSDAEKLWFALCIMAHRFRYSYGRAPNTSLRSLTVPPPPDFVLNGALPTMTRHHQSVLAMISDAGGGVDANFRRHIPKILDAFAE